MTCLTVSVEKLLKILFQRVKIFCVSKCLLQFNVNQTSLAIIKKEIFANLKLRMMKHCLYRVTKKEQHPQNKK